ncbi:hypothetical protein JIN85_15535 [Luteolibacter pohnpeiensis]|uniref:Abnormal spindle-like microcephaly-associated protein ASH domain-containing protein n=2 Tax=Luteolibacter pohnpeiensis TaxID=454153 RepID=A0A934S9P8_9BACT|nr:hypothetical protein [Luteolibacter pohnpeiensis]
MNEVQAEGGKWSGAWLEVTGPAGKSIVQVIDIAPSLGEGDLDMGPIAFSEVTGNSEGRYPITWHWISAPGDIGPIHFYSQSSNPYYLKLQAANIVNPVEKMEILVNGVYTDMPVTTDHFFVYSGNLIAEPFTIRVTDIIGNQVVSSGLTISDTAGGQNGSGNFPAVEESAISLERPAGTVISNDGGYALGYSMDGAALAVDFIIRNTGTADLSGLAVTIDGTNAADFSITANPASSLASTATTSFTISFATTQPSARSCVLHITTNEGKSIDLELNGTGISSTSDSDSDGMNDAAEVKLADFGFDWKVNQSDLVAKYYRNASSAGLYSADQVHAMQVGTPLIQRNSTDGTFTLKIALKKSTDLTSFLPLLLKPEETSVNGSGEIELQFSSQDDAAFFRVEAQ